MVDIVYEWNDNTITSNDVFSGITDFTQDLLVRQWQSVNASVAGAEYNDGSGVIRVKIDANYVLGDQNSLFVVASNHSPTELEKKRLNKFSGTTDSNGEFSFTYPNRHSTVPEILTETPDQRGIYFHISSSTASGGTITARRFSDDTVVSGAHVTCIVVNSSLGLI